jgi:hypothetical protein
MGRRQRPGETVENDPIRTRCASDNAGMVHVYEVDKWLLA